MVGALPPQPRTVTWVVLLARVLFESTMVTSIA